VPLVPLVLQAYKAPQVQLAKQVPQVHQAYKVPLEFKD
jgi:hypothetical protein